MNFPNSVSNLAVICNYVRVNALLNTGAGLYTMLVWNANPSVELGISKTGNLYIDVPCIFILRGKTFPSSVPSQRLMAQLGESFATKDAREHLYKDLP